MLVSKKKTNKAYQRASTLVGEPNTSANKWSTGNQRRARSKPSKEGTGREPHSSQESWRKLDPKALSLWGPRSKFIQIIDDYLV